MTVALATPKNDFQIVFLIKNEPRAHAFGSFDFLLLMLCRHFPLPLNQFYKFIFFEQSDKLSQSLVEGLGG